MELIGVRSTQDAMRPRLGTCCSHSAYCALYVRIWLQVQSRWNENPLKATRSSSGSETMSLNDWCGHQSLNPRIWRLRQRADSRASSSAIPPSPSSHSCQENRAMRRTMSSGALADRRSCSSRQCWSRGKFRWSAAEMMIVDQSSGKDNATVRQSTQTRTRVHGAASRSTGGVCWRTRLIARAKISRTSSVGKSFMIALAPSALVG
uniref:Uncharacterized protein n=1 Tax=Mycena chlorophos TaxID=658473 RepID=A0ABQ0M5D3_MYCCL|nr:predicted protein [Mycena chlorophos]